jgi:hypothetical protein
LRDVVAANRARMSSGVKRLVVMASGGADEDVALDLVRPNREEVERAIALIDREPGRVGQPGNIGSGSQRSAHASLEIGSSRRLAAMANSAVSCGAVSLAHAAQARIAGPGSCMSLRARGLLLLPSKRNFELV